MFNQEWFHFLGAHILKVANVDIVEQNWSDWCRICDALALFLLISTIVTSLDRCRKDMTDSAKRWVGDEFSCISCFGRRFSDEEVDREGAI